jgi:hypothetical protein
MSNILPEHARKKVGRDNAARLVLAVSLVSLAISFVAFLALLPVEIALQIEGRTVARIQQGAPPGQEVNADATALTDMQSLLNIIGPYAATSSAPLSAIRAAIDDRPAGTLITAISYDASSKNITVTGQGSNVSAYATALREDGRFTGVQIPVGALVGGNKLFTVTLTGNF